MKTSFWSKAILFTSLVIALAACKDKGPHFTVEGIITDADSTMLYLERRSISETTIIDSAKLNKDGNFRFEEPALGYPEFYLLRINDQRINLAIDSIETLNISASKPNFATGYTIEGSESSMRMKDLVFSQHQLSLSIADLNKRYNNKDISQEDYISEVQKVIEEYKTKTKSEILNNTMDMSSYFALFQRVDGYLIFDPYEKKDLPLFRAVATIWDKFRPNSPRAEHLKTYILSVLEEIKLMEKQEETLKKLENMPASDYVAHYEISLPDINGNVVNLSSMKGKVTILDFTIYQTEFSPTHNIQLNNVYSKYKNNINIYQVSFDADIHAWKNSAVNLPWVCVRENASNSDILTKYNVQGFPTVFLINKEGEVTKRILPSDDLEAEVKKLL